MTNANIYVKVYSIMIKILTLILILISASFITPGYSYWIWTPKTGKWVNPKTMVKSTPKEQFDFAKSLYDVKNYEEAKKEFNKLLKSYPKSAEAAESYYYIGLINETTGNIYEAYQAYQKIIDKYPFSERIQELIEREYKIAERFMSGEKRMALGVTLPVENPALEIFAKVVENSTYGPLASKSQYKLGLVLKGLGRYYEAEDAFNKVISSYPDSEWVKAAKFQIAACRGAVSRGPDYDQGATKEAKDKFEEFLRENPDAVLSNDAEKSISDLREKEAESSFNIARFYEKQGEYKAARVYYEDLLINYPRSKWAEKAQARIDFMEKKNGKK